MTDLEINRALALAIGYEAGHEPGLVYEEDGELWVAPLYGRRRVFDYRDPSVIWPIAKQYDLFPMRWQDGWIVCNCKYEVQDTPEKAVALAVIEANKK